MHADCSCLYKRKENACCVGVGLCLCMRMIGREEVHAWRGECEHHSLG